MDCQEEEFEGFDDNPPPVKDDDGNLRATMLEQCHDPTKPQPTIPEFTCGDGSDEVFDDINEEFSDAIERNLKMEKKLNEELGDVDAEFDSFWPS